MPRTSLRGRLSQPSPHSFPRKGSEQSKPVELTPLAQRLVSAIRSVSGEYPELQMITEGFIRSMRKRPYTDEEISETLNTVKKYIDGILEEPTAENVG